MALGRAQGQWGAFAVGLRVLRLATRLRHLRPGLDAPDADRQLGVSLGERREGSQEVFVGRYALFLGSLHLVARISQVFPIHKEEG